jgi:acyl-CoA synthetase (AMP-forming)/AMP-acid ligase II
VHIVGRNKDLIISGGYNIYPKEIELVLDDQPGVLESAVIGVPHPDFGETVLGVIVPEPGRQTPDLDAIGPGAAKDRWRGSSIPKKLIVIVVDACRATRWARCRRTSCANEVARIELEKPAPIWPTGSCAHPLTGSRGWRRSNRRSGQRR